MDFVKLSEQHFTAKKKKNSMSTKRFLVMTSKN